MMKIKKTRRQGMAQFKKEKKEMYLNAMVSCCDGVIPDK